MKMMYLKYYEALRTMPAWKEPEIFVNVQSSAEWFLTDGPGYQTHSWKNEPPTIVPPWPLSWLEFESPSANIKVDDYSLPLTPRKFGTLITCHSIPDHSDLIPGHQAITAEGKKLRPAELRDLYDRVDEDHLHALRREQENIKWIVWFDSYTARNNIVELNGAAFTYARDDGSDTQLWTIFSALDQEGIPSMKLWLLDPFLFSIGLLHCKNVHFEDVPIPPKVRKKRTARGIPDITCKTLVVEPMRQQVHREAAADPTGERNHIQRALHIARGHFKDYRDGPGLFGKYQGLYWWDMHVRGTANAGTIVKDYRVKL